MSEYRAEIVVVGGGISGLTAAWKLKRSGHEVLLLEREAKVGGNLRTVRENGYLLEQGPHSWPGFAENVWRLVEDLGLTSKVISASPESNKRYVYRNGKLHPLPMGPWSFITTPLLSLGAKWRLMQEPFRKSGAQHDESAAEFFTRRFGEEAVRYLAGPFISGIYGGDPEQLGARAAFPKFWNFENEAGSMIRGAMHHMKAKKKAHPDQEPRRGLFSFSDGLGVLAATLRYVWLEDEVRTGVAVESIEAGEDGYEILAGSDRYRCRALVVATPPDAAARMLAGLDDRFGDILNGIPMAPMLVVHFGGENASRSFPEGFGCLIPRHYDIRTLGTVFASNLYEGRAPENRWLATSFIGGMFDREAMELDDAQAAKIAFEDQETLYGQAPGDFVRILRHPSAIPQLLPDHPERIETLLALSSTYKALVFTGNYLTGVGVDHAVGSGYLAATQVEHKLREFER